MDNFLPFESLPFLQDEDTGQTVLRLQTSLGIPFDGVSKNDFYVRI